LYKKYVMCFKREFFFDNKRDLKSPLYRKKKSKEQLYPKIRVKKKYFFLKSNKGAMKDYFNNMNFNVQTFQFPNCRITDEECI